MATTGARSASSRLAPTAAAEPQPEPAAPQVLVEPAPQEPADVESAFASSAPQPVVETSAPVEQAVEQSAPEPAVEHVVEVAPEGIEPELPGPALVDLAEIVEHCAQCGAALAATDIFCPECGFVRHRPSGRARPNDTVALDPFPWGLPRTELLRTDEAVDESSRPLPSALPGDPAFEHSEPAASEPAPVIESVPASEAAAHPFADDELDVDETRIVDRAPRGERFVLQFSTGESVSVSGTGLIGRNPMAEPGEFFDLLVTIVDPGRSVSKTHLEFGQDAGSFWISDRFSGNGTVVREPDRAPKRCEAGKRYRVARGTRVEIGEQFFIVS